MTQKWQPIKTAPNDGAHVLVYDHGQACVCEAYYHTDTGEWVRANLWDQDEDSLLSEVTAWMPLPEPPSR